MSRLDEHYARLEAEWRATGHQAVPQEVYSKITQYSADNASRTFVGDIIFGFVPQMEKFQKKPTQQENELEFTTVLQFLFQVFELESVKQLVEEYFGHKR